MNPRQRKTLYKKPAKSVFAAIGKINTCAWLLLMMVVIPFPARSQEKKEITDHYIRDIIGFTEAAYGIDQQLANGPYFDDIFYDAIGHPYFMADNFVLADLVYKNKKYIDVPVKYDISLQRLLVLHTDPSGNYASVLFNEFIMQFSMYGMLFRKIQFGEMAPAFYQVIVDSDRLGCYYQWSKPMDEVINDQDKYVPSFTETVRKNYLCMDGTLARYRNNRSFVRQFPSEIRRTIRKYLKSNGIRVAECKEEKMREVIHYCAGLYKPYTAAP